MGKVVDNSFSKRVYREIKKENEINTSEEQLKLYFTSDDYDVFVVEYRGDLEAKITTLPYAKFYIGEGNFAIVFIEKGSLNLLLESATEIVNIEPFYVYTLSELFQVKSEFTYTIPKGRISLDGEGVIVGIICTGIDYLSPRFIEDNGESKIVALWDQRNNIGPSPKGIPYGTNYSKENLDVLIKSNSYQAYNENTSSEDSKEFGTPIAGLIGGKKLEKNEIFESIAPKCQFAVVNLKPAAREFNKDIGIREGLENVYRPVEVYTALKYLQDVQQALKKPMVVYLTLENNSGGRRGETVIERYIDYISANPGFCVVASTGNQGHGETHSKRILSNTGPKQNIFINMGELRESLYVSIYTRLEGKIHIGITAPTGESIAKLPMEKINKVLFYEEQGISLDYLIQEKPNDIKNIEIIIRNAKKGIWNINFLWEDNVAGIVDTWLLPKELLQTGTRFFNVEPYTTLQTPGTAKNIITASYYGTKSKAIVINSGKGFPRDGEIQPIVACEGTNILTVGKNNQLIVCNGPAIAGAIVAGAVALVFQWAFLQKNYTELNIAALKNILIASTTKDKNIIYPNEEWGYGMLSFKILKQTLYDLSNTSKVNQDDNTSVEGSTRQSLYISMPEEVYYRIK